MQLSKLRKENRLTQNQMATKLNIATATYNMYENGKRQISNEIAINIASILSVRVTDIFLPSSFMIRE